MYLLNYTGGLDSTVMLRWAIKNEYSFQTVYFDYGFPPNIKERQLTQNTARDFGFSHSVIDFSSLIKSSGFPPFQSVQRLLRHQEMIEILEATSLMPSCNEIMIGALKGEGAFSRFEMYQINSLELKLFMPFSKMTKAEVIQMGCELSVDFKKTWSCLISGVIHCGFCEACLSRKAAFISARVDDPTEYYMERLLRPGEKTNFVKDFFQPFNEHTKEYPNELVANFDKVINDLSKRFPGVTP